MGKYLKEFELISQYEEYINSDMAILPNVSIINDINGVYYNPNVPNYLKFTAEEDNSTISLYGVTSPDIKYSLNGGDWAQWDYSAITLNTGDTVCMKGNNSNGFSKSLNPGTRLSNQFRMTGKIGASGNIMSLLYEDKFEGKLTIPCDCCFADMFSSCISLTTTPELPATTLTFGCYDRMFANCTTLTTAPELPATSLTNYCYSYMFDGCTSLTTAPELPATTLVNCCYYDMFRNCSSLSTAPELLATTLMDYCYQEMFSGCTNLNYIKMLATDISATGCLDNWVYRVSSTGTFVKDPNMTSLPTGDSGIPTGWEVQDVA